MSFVADELIWSLLSSCGFSFGYCPAAIALTLPSNDDPMPLSIDAAAYPFSVALVYRVPSWYDPWIDEAVEPTFSATVDVIPWAFYKA